MPYSFIEIEKQKNWVIGIVFVFLVIFYFLIAELIWLVTKFFFILEAEIFEIRSFLSVTEAVIVLFIALFIALIHWHFSIKDSLSRILNLLGAVEPDPKDSYHQIFKNIVEEVSVATGGSHISCCIVPHSGLNAFAISDFSRKAVIGVTEGLLAKLNRSQLEAVIAHEAAHIASGDSLLTTITCSLFGVYSGLFEVVKRGISHTRRAGRGVIFLFIIYIILSITQFINILLNMFLSRQKEYRADAISVKLTRNPISLAEALYIISRGWRGVGEISNSISPIFIMSPDYNNLEEREGFVSDLFSTHPPTEKRLGILLDMAHSNILMLKEGIRPKQKVPIETYHFVKKEEVCPECQQSMGEILYEGASVLKCHYCSGLFANRDVIPRIIMREDFAFDPSIQKLAEIILKTYTKGIRIGSFKVAYKLDCPKCKEKMVRGFFSYGYPIEVDSCQRCQNVWFNKDELEVLQYLYEKHKYK